MTNLTGIQIFKYLPGAKKTENANCKKCGCPTCMAFALKLAQKKVEIEACPFAPQELIDIFSEYSKIQQNTVIYGKNVQIGGETVMLRHERTFINKTSFVIKLLSNDKEFDKKLEKISSWQLERVTEIFKIDGIYLEDNGGDIDKCVEKIAQKGLGLIINTTNYKDEYDKFNPIVENSLSKNANNIVTASNVEEFDEKVSNILKQNKKLVLNLDIENKSTKELIEELTKMRRLAIINRDENFAHPFMVKLFNCKNSFEAAAKGAFLICRYASLIVFDELNEALISTLATLRQGIYTDPQKPLQVEAKVYEICEPNENAFVVLTTNFALTYFAVANELESLSIPMYLIIAPADGMSVLTAWSADKFNVDIAVKAIKNANLADKVKHKQIIIPGLLADMKDELQEAIDDWEIVVGTKDVVDMQDFIKELEVSRK